MILNIVIISIIIDILSALEVTSMPCWVYQILLFSVLPIDLLHCLLCLILIRPVVIGSR